MKTALVIMAAGIGSRFGGGIKQLAAVGPNGEIIMDYSIHDAIEAGFDKIVFIIRHDIEEAFKEAIGDRIEKICADLGVEIDYAFQALENVPEGYSVPEGRSKPWGTGQAVLACKGIIKEPFAVINADDYYGKEAFVEFFEKAAPANPLKAEYLLPIYIDELLHADKVSVKVLPTHDKWFGVTYAEDKQIVIDSFAKLVADGVYEKDLFSDLKK